MMKEVNVDKPSDKNGVYFSREQYEYLEKLFPEQVHDSTATLSAVMYHNGKRSVVHLVKSRVK